MKKVVVFGASGNTGTYFVKYFLENNSDKDYEVVAVGTRETQKFDELGVTYYRVDITKKEEFDKLPEDVYAVVDLAGAMPARMKGYDPQYYIDVNITGNLNILEYCRKNHADRILFAQSFGDIKDYGETELVLKADMPRKFSFASDHTIYLYSPIDHYYVDGVSRKIGYRLLIDKARAGETIEVWGDSSRVKDMVYVKDFCQMLYKAVFVNRDCGYYNVGTGIGTSLLDQIKGMVEVFGEAGKKSQIVMRPDKPNAPQYIMDITPAREELGYTPKYDYISMLKDIKREMYSAEGNEITKD